MLDDMDLGWIETARLRPLKRKEFDRLAEIGAFGPEEKVELIRGFIFQMSPIGPRHNEALERLDDFFHETLRGRARIRVQSAFALSDDSEPQPDLFLFPDGDYRQENPSRALLVIEVADSSLAFDRRVKKEIYAEQGVPEYWIVNLRERVIEAFDQPAGGTYQRSRVVAESESISPGSFPDVVLSVARILP